MARIFIIHGYSGYPEKNWFPWLKAELLQRGFAVEVPAMPTPEAPKMIEWRQALLEAVGSPTQDTFFVGHSLGCIAIVRYLESLPKDVVVGGAIFVAGFSRPLVTHPQLDEFTQVPVNYEYCRNRASSFIAINSDNDPYVPLEEGSIFQEKLGATLHVYQNGGHINESSGVMSLPLVVEELSRITAR